MNNNLTDVTFLVDRSGSMADIKEKVESTMKEILQSQQNGPGECRLTVYQFNTGNLFQENKCVLDKTVDGVKIEDVKSITINPTGGTPLIDALCKTIDETGSRFARLREEERPGKVVFVIVTDGEENSSRQFGWKDSQDRVKRQSETYNWLFMYVGCNQDALKEGENLGLKRSSSMTYKTSDVGMKGLSASVGSKLGTIRGMSASEYTSYNASAEIFDKNDYETQEKA